MFSKKEIWRIAMEQSARDLNCDPEDFLKPTPVVASGGGGLSAEAKKYYKAPIPMNFVSYGSNVVVSALEGYKDIAAEYIHTFEFYRCFEPPAIHWLDERLAPFQQKVCFMAEYQLPDPEKVRPLPCAYPLKVLEQKDFSGLYLPEWHNALCEDRKELDVLGVGAYDREALIGLAGCSADAEMMWQIGVDVLPEYRGQGIAAALTSRLALEILERNKVPFYCSAWSNLLSVRNALRCGFTPAWVEMTVKPEIVINEMQTYSGWQQEYYDAMKRGDFTHGASDYAKTHPSLKEKQNIEL
ncbi:MAG: GNAT family N-acetyltransferase [Clostridia bacterium]|nr:GNAT family N-acetyltransferase [Clostridia bacterium]